MCHTRMVTLVLEAKRSWHRKCLGRKPHLFPHRNKDPHVFQAIRSFLILFRSTRVCKTQCVCKTQFTVTDPLGSATNRLAVEDDAGHGRNCGRCGDSFEASKGVLCDDGPWTLSPSPPNPAMCTSVARARYTGLLDGVCGARFASLRIPVRARCRASRVRSRNTLRCHWCRRPLPLLRVLLRVDVRGGRRCLDDAGYCAGGERRARAKRAMAAAVPQVPSFVQVLVSVA